MQKTKLYLAGTGGFAREVLYLMEDLNLYDNLNAFIEPDNIWEEKWKDKILMGKPVLPFSEVNNGDSVSIGIGDAIIRKKTTTQLPEGLNYISLIHPSANVSRWTKIGNGCIITAGCIVTTQINIGDHCQLNLNTTIGHDCVIGDYFTTAPSVNISGICEIGNNVYFGTGAATRQGVKICDDVVIGMGAMVVKNIENPGTYIGIPAKKL